MSGPVSTSPSKALRLGLLAALLGLGLPAGPASLGSSAWAQAAATSSAASSWSQSSPSTSAAASTGTSGGLAPSPAPAATPPAAAPPAAAAKVDPQPVKTGTASLGGGVREGSLPKGAGATTAAVPPSDAASTSKPAKARSKKSKKVEPAEAPIDPPKPANLLEALFGTPAPPADPEATSATTDPAAKPAKGKKARKAKKGAETETAALPAPVFPSGGDELLPPAGADLGPSTVSQANVEPLKAAIKRYEAIVADGGWPSVPALQMQVGTNNEAVATLRQRLTIEGDLKSEPSLFGGPTYFDQTLADALAHFQERYGLTATGDTMDKDRLKNGTRTILALNLPADERLRQLKGNLGRLQAQGKTRPGRYVLVNIPAQQIEVVEGDRVVMRLNGVVGKPDRPSPLLSSVINEVKFNPVWTLPPTVVKEDLIPKGQKMQRSGQDVLAKFGIDAYDGAGRKVVDTAGIDWSKVSPGTYRYSQQPSKDNPLGFAKLDFASPESVYMHDTPSAKLFDKSYRAASSGCIRVERMERLVAWLLKETEGWSGGRVLAMKESGESKVVPLKRGVPLYWVYYTAWATADGEVHFRRDLYGKDEAFGVNRLASVY